MSITSSLDDTGQAKNRELYDETVKELNEKTKEIDRHYENYEKAELESQKWREKCVGLEATNKILCEQKDKLLNEYGDSARRCQELEEKYRGYDREIKDIRQDSKNLVEKNERLDVLVLCFRGVLQEIFSNKTSNFSKGGNKQ